MKEKQLQIREVYTILNESLYTRKVFHQTCPKKIKKQKQKEGKGERETETDRQKDAGLLFDKRQCNKICALEGSMSNKKKFFSLTRQQFLFFLQQKENLDHETMLYDV